MPLLLTDLDDTLVDRKGAFASWARSFVYHLGLEEDDADWLVKHDFDGREDRERFFEHVIERWSLPFTREQLVADYDEKFPRHFPPVDPDAVAALTGLRAAGWRVAVVTNGSPRQLRKMVATGAIALLDCWCISAEVGVRKPDPAIFEVAARRCGTALSGGWMVGDSPEADIAGGHRAGLHTAWVSRGRVWERRDFGPDLTIDSLAKAVSAIRAYS